MTDLARTHLQRAQELRRAGHDHEADVLRNQVVTSLLPVARRRAESRARLLARHGLVVDVAELQAMASLALVEAVDDYDPDRGVPVEAWVVLRLVHALRPRRWASTSIAVGAHEYPLAGQDPGHAYDELRAMPAVDAAIDAHGLLDECTAEERQLLAKWALNPTGYGAQVGRGARYRKRRLMQRLRRRVLPQTCQAEQKAQKEQEQSGNQDALGDTVSDDSPHFVGAE